MPRKHIKIVSRKLGTGFYLVVVCSFNETVYLVEDNWRPEAPQQKEKRPADERWSVWQWDPKGYPELKHAVTVEEIKQDPLNGVYEEITTARSKKECINYITVWAFAEQIGT